MHIEEVCGFYMEDKKHLEIKSSCHNLLYEYIFGLVGKMYKLKIY
jgi:hypothetical protein